MVELEQKEKENQVPAQSDNFDASFIDFLDPQNASFKETPGKLLSLKNGDKDYPRVTLNCSFPHSAKQQYISVRDPDNKEVGMIKDLDDFDMDTQTLLKKHLSFRYFCPVIQKILSLKEEFGYTFWETETTEGVCRFVIRRDGKSTGTFGKEILIVDVDGNRFVIPDVTKLSEKEYKQIELYI